MTVLSQTLAQNKIFRWSKLILYAFDNSFLIEKYGGGIERHKTALKQEFMHIYW